MDQKNKNPFQEIGGKTENEVKAEYKKKKLFTVSEIYMGPGMGDKGLEMRGFLG